MSEVLAGPIFFAEFVGPGGVGALLPSASYFLPRNGPCGGQNRPFGGCWAADLPAAESRGRRRCAVGQLGRAASAPHRGGRQRSKRHPGATSGRRTGPFSVLGGPWRSQRRPGTRAAGPHVRPGEVKRRRKSPNGVPELPSKGRSKRRRLWKSRSRAVQGEASVLNDLCHRRRQMCPTVDALSQFSVSSVPCQWPLQQARTAPGTEQRAPGA